MKTETVPAFLLRAQKTKMSANQKHCNAVALLTRRMPKTSRVALNEMVIK
jgi:hypothetical protein